MPPGLSHLPRAASARIPPLAHRHRMSRARRAQVHGWAAAAIAPAAAAAAAAAAAPRLVSVRLAARGDRRAAARVLLMSIHGSAVQAALALVHVHRTASAPAIPCHRHGVSTAGHGSAAKRWAPVARRAPATLPAVTASTHLALLPAIAPTPHRTATGTGTTRAVWTRATVASARGAATMVRGPSLLPARRAATRPHRTNLRPRRRARASRRRQAAADRPSPARRRARHSAHRARRRSLSPAAVPCSKPLGPASRAGAKPLRVGCTAGIGLPDVLLDPPLPLPHLPFHLQIPACRTTSRPHLFAFPTASLPAHHNLARLLYHQMNALLPSATRLAVRESALASACNVSWPRAGRCPAKTRFAWR